MNLRVNLSKANLPVGLPRSLAARLLTKIIGAAAKWQFHILPQDLLHPASRRLKQALLPQN